MDNLNRLRIRSDNDFIRLEDHNRALNNASFNKAEVYFKNIETALIKKINVHSDGFIFGSVAWLTSDKIIGALSKCSNVQIVIQKEDFLRPDYGDSVTEQKRRQRYRDLYSQLRFKHDKFDCLSPICDLSTSADPTIEPVRCLGNFNSDRNKSTPRAHNKFLVFCKQKSMSNDFTRRTGEPIYHPVAVWSGSFNFTKNADKSFENALYLEDSSGTNPIITAYLKEHHQIFALSESLDWRHNWSAPDYRIGT